MSACQRGSLIFVLRPRVPLKGASLWKQKLPPPYLPCRLCFCACSFVLINSVSSSDGICPPHGCHIIPFQLISISNLTWKLPGVCLSVRTGFKREQNIEVGGKKERRTKSTKKKDVKKTSLTKRKKVKSRSRGGRTERQTRQRHQRSKTSNKVQPTVWVLVLTHPYLISKFILPGQLHTLFVQPLTESRSIYLSPLYLSDKSIQACIQACNSQLRRGSVSLNTKHTSMQWKEPLWSPLRNVNRTLESNFPIAVH